MEILPVIVLYVEVLLMALIERKLWRTPYTPLNCLMVPYAVVLAFCMAIDGKMDFVPFYYPSVWVWVVGIALFFIPSFFFGILFSAATRGKELPQVAVFEATRQVLGKLTRIILVLFFFWTIFLMLTFSAPIGSDAFGAKFSGNGIFGHLSTVMMILGIIWIFLIDKYHKNYVFYILGFFVVAFLCLVKSWMIIPIVSALIMRLLMKRIHLKVKLVLGMAVFGFVFFFASYWVSMFLVRVDWATKQYNVTRSEYAQMTARYIQKHFVTYLVAGVYGFSEDMAMGIVEERDPDKVFTAVVNIGNVLTGQPVEEKINDKFVITTRADSGTNVRTFMGFLYVFLGPWQAALFVFLFSILVNVLFFVARQRANLFALVWSSWVCGYLFMGWFEFYLMHLNFLTVPVFLAMLAEISFWAENRSRQPRLLPPGYRPSSLKSGAR